MKQLILLGGLALFSGGCANNRVKASEEATAKAIAPAPTPEPEPILEIPEPLSPQELRSQLADQEAASWQQYLGNALASRRNLIDETVIEGPIQNNSTAVVFKNFVLKVTWEAKTGAELRSVNKMIYEELLPNQSVNIKVKFPTPDETAFIRWAIVNVDTEPLTGPNSESAQ